MELVSYLLLLLAVQQAFWLYSTHKLINKLMARDFGDYVRVQRKENRTVPRETDSAQEDLRVLQEFSA